jgi:hypothetical protein
MNRRSKSTGTAGPPAIGSCARSRLPRRCRRGDAGLEAARARDRLDDRDRWPVQGKDALLHDRAQHVVSLAAIGHRRDVGLRRTPEFAELGVDAVAKLVDRQARDHDFCASR